MATPMEKRNALLAEKLIQNLGKRHMEAFYCPTAEEACQKALSLIGEGSSVTWGGSMTIRDIGLTKRLVEGNYNAYDRDAVTDPALKEEGVRKAFFMDWFLASPNAISEDGQLVNIDGVGLNKVAQDLDAAIKRARSTAAPINTARIGCKTPCQVDGVCHDCLSPDCICNYIHITRNSKDPDRIKIILVGESLGY